MKRPEGRPAFARSEPLNDVIAVNVDSVRSSHFEEREILALVTDAFGGRGGIAKFNRDLLEAICREQGVSQVDAFPRLVQGPTGLMPNKLSFRTSCANGKVRYVVKVLLAAVRHGRYDAIVCGHCNLLPIAYLASILTDSPLLLIIHGIEAWTPTRSRLANFLARRIDAFVAVSELTKNRFLAWAALTPDRGVVIPNSIDLAKFRPKEKEERLLERYGLANRKVILTVCRLCAAERMKGVDEVLESLPSLLKKIPEISYLIVGEGDDRPRLEEKARLLGLNERVIFAGFVSEVEKVDHFCLADAYVMPSYGEGFGIVLLEAMACGIPVVASNIDGGREALRDGALGVLVDPRDANSISRGILEALSKPRGTVPQGLEFFSFSNFEHRWHKFLRQLCALPRRTRWLRE